jgi:hypothetical protein
MKICRRQIDVAVDAIVIAAFGEFHVKRVERGSIPLPEGDLIGPYFNSIRILIVHSFFP